MAFGGFFGGSSNNNDKDKSSQSAADDASLAPTAQAVFPPSAMPQSSSSSSSADIKNRLTTAISTQSNIINAKLLIQKINENCFDHCITSPGASLSSKENQCLSACMEKYIDGWNTVSKTYVMRLQKEGAQLGMGGSL